MRARVLYAFLAEINLAMCYERFDENRVRLGIKKLESLFRLVRLGQY